MQSELLLYLSPIFIISLGYFLNRFIKGIDKLENTIDKVLDKYNDLENRVIIIETKQDIFP